jgi:hypothetical protein
MPSRKNRALLVLAILVIAQGALSSAWAVSRCVAGVDCGAMASSPCAMASHMAPHTAPCEDMSADCGRAAIPKVLCEEGCARVFSKAPAVIALAPDAPPASAAGVLIVLPIDAPRASLASGAALAPSSRGRPALWLTTHSLLI